MTPEEFGMYLKRLRKNVGLTLTQLSQESLVSQPHLSHIENGKRGIPSPEILQRIHKPLGVTHAELMVKAGHVKYEDWFHNVSEDKSLEEYNELFYPEMFGYTSTEEYLKEIIKHREELIHVLQLEQTTYNGHRLTDSDRQRISDMLKALFPEYGMKE